MSAEYVTDDQWLACTELMPEDRDTVDVYWPREAGAPVIIDGEASIHVIDSRGEVTSHRPQREGYGYGPLTWPGHDQPLVKGAR